MDHIIFRENYLPEDRKIFRSVKAERYISER